MKTITRYILKEFLSIFLLSLTAFITLYLLIDFFEKIDDLVEHNVTTLEVFQFFLYKIPLIFYQVAPVAILLSTLLSLSLLSRHHEITAIKSSGISILRVTIPILISAIVVSIISFIVNEEIAPVTNQRVEDIKQTKVEGKTDTIAFQQGRFWYRGDGVIYSISYLDPKRNTIKGLTLYEMDRDFNPTKRIDAQEAVWVNGKWVVKNGFLTEFRTGEAGRITPITIPISGWILRLSEGPEGFKRVERLAEEMGFKELQGYVKRLKREGYNPTRYTVDLYNKVSFPVVSVIMALIGIPFAVKGGRHSGIATGVGLSFIIGFSYWVIFAINTSLGYSGLIPPLVASWATNIIFAAMGVLMFTYVRQ
ncbi:MAG: LPS export ABC transporter permease LptG [Deltaproteobacteria bacterium]|nr:LPS export ABC transporter permease LptG [Deltaproteobacteria bacterium]